MEVNVTTDSFQAEVVQSDIPVIVDFWAEWCVPCKMVEPVLEDIAGQYDGQVKVARVNVDEHPELAEQHNIVSIPTLLLFKGGEVANQHIGAAPKDQIEELFKPYL